MSNSKLSTKQIKLLPIITLIAVLFGIYFLRNFLMLIIFAAVMSILFNPAYSYFVEKGKSNSKASVYTFFISSLVVIVPVLIIGFITFFQLQNLVNNISSNNYNIDINTASNDIIVYLNGIFERVGIDYILTAQEVVDGVTNAAAAFGKVLFDQIVSTFSGLFGFITAAIIYIYVFLSMLSNKETIINTIKRLNPLGNEVSSLYIDRVNSMTKATVRGQFIIAFMQGLASAVILSFVGPSSLFFFWLLLLTVMSVIPLGAGIITIPVGIVMMLTGNVFGGVLVISNHLLIVTNIDNVMRPKLVPRDARLDPALMILAVFAGLGLFGFLGIVIGPIIMILIVTTIQIYNEVFYKEFIDRRKENKKSKFQKLKNDFIKFASAEDE